VTDNDGLTNTTTKVIYVSHKPTAVAEVNRTNVTEPGGWVLFNGSNSTCDMLVNNSLSYNWTIHGATYTGENVTYNVTNTTTAILTVTDEYGCTATNNTTVTYLLRPIPVINFTATGCLEVELNASNSSDPDGNITDYLWDAENGSIDNNTNVTCTANFSVGGNHTVRLNVTDNDGLTNSTTREIYISCVPTAAARANRTNVTVPGGMVLFDAPNSTCDTVGDANNSLNYIWTIHGTPHDDSSGEGIEYFVTNTTTAFLTVTDEYNCTAADNVTVTCQHPPVAEFGFNGTGCKVGILNASASYDPDGNIEAYEWDLDNDSIYGEPDDDATNITCTFGPVPAGEHWIGLKVTDNASASNITRKQITVTGNPNAVAEANGHTDTLQLPEGGSWVVFNGTNSTAYPGTEIVNASCTWNVPGMSTYYGLGPLPPVFINRDTTATLTVVANNTCTDVSSVEVLMPPTMKEDVPILTPAGMIALISLLCIVGGGRITKKDRRS
jgi:hypothetical protein